MKKKVKDNEEKEKIEKIDYILCEYCNRKFNNSAGERHIPFCREKYL